MNEPLNFATNDSRARSWAVGTAEPLVPMAGVALGRPGPTSPTDPARSIGEVGRLRVSSQSNANSDSHSRRLRRDPFLIPLSSFRARSRKDPTADGGVQVEHAPSVPDQSIAIEADDLVVVSPRFKIFDRTDLT